MDVLLAFYDLPAEHWIHLRHHEPDRVDLHHRPPAVEQAGRVAKYGTEAINMLIENTRRLPHGHGDFDNYRLRIFLAGNGTGTSLPSEDDVTTLKSEEPVHGTSACFHKISASTASPP